MSPIGEVTFIMMKQRSDAAMNPACQAMICASSGLLLSGALSAPAVAQEIATAPVIFSPATMRENAPRPTVESPSHGRFAVAPKPPSQKPNALWSPSKPTPHLPPEVPAQERPVRVTLQINERRVYVYRGDTVEASYPVAVGRSGWETPTGQFKVFSTVSEPGWTNPFTNEQMSPGEDNPLGDRWIAFWTDGENMIGFHGTPNRDSIGKAASHGCVRMYNEHVRELFELVDIGTPVTVVL